MEGHSVQYYVNSNAQPNGDHEVHIGSCTQGPDEANKVPLGDFATCTGAVTAAKKIYAQSNGCFYCSNDCHTT